MTDELDLKKEPIQENPFNPRNPKRDLEAGDKTVPKDAEAKQLVKEVEALEKEFEDKEEEKKPFEKMEEKITMDDYLGKKREFTNQTK